MKIYNRRPQYNYTPDFNNTALNSEYSECNNNYSEGFVGYEVTTDYVFDMFKKLSNIDSNEVNTETILGVMQFFIARQQQMEISFRKLNADLMDLTYKFQEHKRDNQYLTKEVKSKLSSLKSKKRFREIERELYKLKNIVEQELHKSVIELPFIRIK